MNKNTSCASIYYKSIFTSRNDNELEKLAQIKRFMERFTADNIFRDKLNGFSISKSQLFADYGIVIDPQEILPLWHYKTYNEQKQDWPLANLYRSFIDDLHKYRSLVRDQVNMSIICPRFHSWRQRQIARCSSEMPASSNANTYPIIAFELSQGCSMGCWFCGVSAEKFEGYYPYTKENAMLWNDIIHISFNIFGKAMYTGFCYWSTEPSDNPDYVKFIIDYQKITGHFPQTTTAAPLKNIDQTKEIMRLSNLYRCAPYRFSVISLPILNKIHQNFSARELVNIELICQNKESNTILSSSGRAREYINKPNKINDLNLFVNIKDEHASIACISGFLVNMITKTVKLVSPVPASKQWPLGYRIHDKRCFRDKDEYKDIIMSMINRNMIESIPSQTLVSFRKDLEFTPLSNSFEEGFILKNRWVEHKSIGSSLVKQFGELVATGKYTANELKNNLISKGYEPFQVCCILQDFFDNGMLNDEHILYE